MYGNGAERVIAACWVPVEKESRYVASDCQMDVTPDLSPGNACAIRLNKAGIN